MANQEHWLFDRIRSHAEKPALVSKGQNYSYADLSNVAELSFTQVVSDFPAGAVVILQSDYSFQSVALFLALLKNCNIIVPVATALEEEVQLRIQESYADYCVTPHENGSYRYTKINNDTSKHPLITKIIGEGHAGLILFSSGSVGKPKAMIHDLTTLALTFANKRQKSICMMVFLMFDHIGGMNTLLNALSMGSHMVFPDIREPDHVAGLIEKYKVRVLPASPTFLNLMVMASVQEKRDLSSLRMITYGTETMPQTLLNRLKELFPRTRLLQTFGTSETGIANVISKSSSSAYMRIEDPNCEHKIVNGELWLRSKTQISGYLNASSDSFTEDGWFNTGDLVEVNENGFFKVVGRSNEVINVGGEKVLPSEIEGVLLQMSEIDDCVVYSKPNAITGQTVAANIVTCDPIAPRELRKLIRFFCRERLAAYKVPTTVKIIDHVDFSARFKKVRKNNG